MDSSKRVQVQSDIVHAGDHDKMVSVAVRPMDTGDQSPVRRSPVGIHKAYDDR